MGQKRKAAASHPPADNPKRSKNKREAKSKITLTVEPRPDWHTTELPPLPDTNSSGSVPKHLLDELHTYALALLDEETDNFAAQTSSSYDSSRKFMTTVMANGTQEDKISALTLAVQESPLHNRKALDSLISLAKKHSRNQALPALSAIVDLMAQGTVLPENRRLRYFKSNSALQEVVSSLLSEGVELRAPFTHLPRPLEPIHLIYWAYEDYLKTAFFQVVQTLEMWCNDEVEYSRSRALSFIHNLLSERPEQEENLLLLLVNKLGDRSKKVASRASYLLLQLQNKHPMMKPIIIKAIESEILFKPGQQSSAKYYAVITLNQTVLSRRESETADKLLKIYIDLFLLILKTSEKDSSVPEASNKNKKFNGKKTKAGQRAKKRLSEEVTAQQTNDRLTAQILSGVNRAFPFANTDGAQFESHLNTIYRITHSANFNTSVQALMLLHQITSSKQYSVDRFYRVLYESLLDPRLLHSSKQVMYLNLLYRAIKADLSLKRVKAFVKRLLQVASVSEPSFACAALFLVSELTKTFPSLKTMFSQPEEKPDDEVEHFVDAPEEDDASQATTTPGNLTGEGLVKSLYDGRKRDPELSNADKSCAWELIPFQSHFHPSVSLFASAILYGTKVPPKPDPTLHTLIHFLDRFVYRGARSSKTSTARGASVMQPLVGSDNSDLLVRNRNEARLRAPMNDPSFWQKTVDQIPADEVFFHQYFHTSGKAKAATSESKRQKKKGGDGEFDGDGEGGDLDEDEIWKALVQSKPEIEGDEDEYLSDDDVDMEGADFSDNDLDMDGMDLEDGDLEGDMFLDEDAADGESDSDGGDIELESDIGSDGDDDISLPSDVEDVLREIEAKSTKKDGSGKESTEEKKSKKKSKAKKSTDGPEQQDSDQDGESKPKTRSQEQRAARRKLKSLPTFASADDYAALIDA